MQPLWPNDYKIPLIVVTGAFGSGKTSFALDIDPVLKGTGKTRTLIVDCENSAADYENQYEMDRIDVPQQFVGLTPAQMWNRVKDTVLSKVRTGQYTNVIFDTFSPLQEGAFENHKSGDTMKTWSETKRDIEKFLTEVGAYVQTIIVIVHLRAKKDKSMEKEPKGVETLKQLASFYLYLHRDPKGTVTIGGKQYPACPNFPYPSGIILKSRLNVTTDQKDEYGGYIRRPLLPDRIPVATPAAIRSRYIHNKAIIFSEEEKMPDISPLVDEMSPDERLLTEQATAEAKVQAARTEWESEQRTAFRKAAQELGFKSDLQIADAMSKSGVGKYDPDQHDEQLEQLMRYARSLQ